METIISIKEKIIGQINNIQDEDLLRDVYNIMYGMQEIKQVMRLNDDQRSMINEAREAYKRGEWLSTEEMFKDLLDDED